MISNGWLKKGKIPVKYSQPIHRRYVYTIIIIIIIILKKKNNNNNNLVTTINRKANLNNFN